MNRLQTKLNQPSTQQFKMSKSNVEQKNDAIKLNFKMNWLHISNCIKHEMYPKIASAVISFINGNKNHRDMEESFDISIESEKN